MIISNEHLEDVKKAYIQWIGHRMMEMPCSRKIQLSTRQTQENEKTYVDDLNVIKWDSREPVTAIDFKIKFFQ